MHAVEEKQALRKASVSRDILLSLTPLPSVFSSSSSLNVGITKKLTRSSNSRSVQPSGSGSNSPLTLTLCVLASSLTLYVSSPSPLGSGMQRM